MGGLARAVDSSVERVELRVRGSLPSYRKIACNGVAVPLSPTEDIETHVAGIRFKAWQVPSSYHPHIPCQSPLVFDLFDLHMNRWRIYLPCLSSWWTILRYLSGQ